MIRLNRGDETLDELYSTAWSRHGDGPEPSAADFLTEHPDASTAERLDVLLTDQLLRWQRGFPRPIAEYLAEHPSLARDSEAILKLVQGEFLARLEGGESPDPDYARMFPAMAEAIRHQCEVDQWLTMPSPSEQSSMAATVDYRDDGRAEPADDGATDDGSRRAPASECTVDLDAPMAEADFRLVGPLGAGGMGEVYEAVQKSLRKRVALKLMRSEALDSPSRVRRFFAEARALARLRHPHIVGVHGIGRMADGRYFLVMDLVEEGTTLAGLLCQGPVPFDRAAELVATVAEAIEHAHSRGVIHRDLKPSNVLLDAEGQPHVTDFGLAKVFDAADPDNPQTTADQILGTPHYMAPEQADPARGPITPRTDVYALGGLLYALLTGKPPIQGDSLTAILTRLVSPEPVPTPRMRRIDVPAALEHICRTCLEKDAEKRYPSAGAVAGAVRSWLANPEVEDPAGAAADFQGRTNGSDAEPNKGRSSGGWAPDRSLKDGGRKTNPGQWAPARSARSPGHRRWNWAAGATVSTLALLLLAVTMLFRPGRMAPPIGPRDVAPGAHTNSIADNRVTPPRPSIKGAPAPPADPISGGNRGVYQALDARELISGWDVRVYRPDADGKSWLDLGDLLDAPIATWAGDRLKLKASFRKPAYAAILAINPDGSVQRLGAPANADTEQPATELSIPPGVDRYIRLTDPGPTALVLLASHQRLTTPAEIIARGFSADAWRTSHAEKTWIFDGEAIVPLLKTRAIEESVGTRPFAALGQAIMAYPGLESGLAVLFEVEPSKPSSK